MREFRIHTCSQGGLARAPGRAPGQLPPSMPVENPAAVNSDTTPVAYVRIDGLA